MAPPLPEGVSFAVMVPRMSVLAKGLPVQYAKVEVKLVTEEARVVEAVPERREDTSPVPMLKLVTTLEGTVTDTDTTATLEVDWVLL